MSLGISSQLRGKCNLPATVGASAGGALSIEGICPWILTLIQVWGGSAG
jgi:hypothetical protein